MSWGALYQSFLARQQRVVLGQHDAAVLGSAGSRVGRRLVIGSTVLGALLVVAAIAVLLLL